MLLFEPKGRSEDEDNDFYIQSKKNICVGCGEGNHYLRYRIIPSFYRLHFPEHMKSHRSHDIVQLCVDCHELAHAAAEKYKRRIASEFDIPLFVRNIVGSDDSEVVSEKSVVEVNFERTGVSLGALQCCYGSFTAWTEDATKSARRIDRGKNQKNSASAGEDLEKAVLVGMSSPERRRLKKKRWLSLKNTKADIFPDNHKSEVRTLNGLCPVLSKDDDLVVEKEFQGSVDNDTPSDEIENDDVDNVESGTVTTETSLDLSNENKRKLNSKSSMLGHVPHRRQVVDCILEEHGEEGVGDFCQRWRQVFVKAVNPTGWDVKHSGRRYFGEFSVYNPTKKEITASTN